MQAIHVITNVTIPENNKIANKKIKTKASKNCNDVRMHSNKKSIFKLISEENLKESLQKLCKIIYVKISDTDVLLPISTQKTSEISGD